MQPRWQWPADCQISPAARAQIEAESAAMEARPRPADDLAGRVRQIERALQPGGAHTKALVAAVGDAIGGVRAELEGRIGLIDARLTALETWTAAANIRAIANNRVQKARIRVQAPSRRIAP